jgi:hypothetical protein
MTPYGKRFLDRFLPGRDPRYVNERVDMFRAAEMIRDDHDLRLAMTLSGVPEGNWFWNDVLHGDDACL